MIIILDDEVDDVDDDADDDDDDDDIVHLVCGDSSLISGRLLAKPEVDVLLHPVIVISISIIYASSST